MHFKSPMRAIKFIQSTPFKLSILGILILSICYFIHANESINAKAKRISFPGMTHVRFNRSMKDLNLEKLAGGMDQTLTQNLNENQITPTSPVFVDKKNNLMVMIGEKTTDGQLVFALIKNNQVTQLQKINEITDQKISLQYGKIILNTKTATASTTAASDAL